MLGEASDFQSEELEQLIEEQQQEAIHLEGRIFDLEQALLGEDGGSQ